MELRELIGMAGVPVIVALVEVVKRVGPEVPERTYPVWALVFGIGLNVLVGWQLGVDPMVSALTGIVAGLAASGLYSQAKVAIG
ncbi:MAG: hypothetical protein HY675_09515 [Chloroflexi bacterium]|nr:hypothetical protein [Chloroflexota bacterium]